MSTNKSTITEGRKVVADMAADDSHSRDNCFKYAIPKINGALLVTDDFYYDIADTEPERIGSTSRELAAARGSGLSPPPFLLEVARSKYGPQRKNARNEGKRKKCTCRFLWNYELHGLTQFLRSRTLGERILWGCIIAMCIVAAVCTTFQVFDEYLEHQTATLITMQQDPRMLFPTVVLCPKNPDSLNYPLVLRDIGKRLPHLDRMTLVGLISFAIAGAGFNNMNEAVERLSSAAGGGEWEMRRLAALFRKWKGRRSLATFYADIFERFGYKCSNFFAACYYGYEAIPCCDVFRPYYVMLRGKCFRIERFYQTDPDVFGRLNLYMNLMPSRLAGTSGVQPQVVVYVSDKYPDVGSFPRYYADFHKPLYLRIKARRISNLPDNPQCTTRVEERGRATCHLMKWLRKKVVEPFNCTVFYLRHKFPHHEICDPELVVRNYLQVLDKRIGILNASERCLPACQRTEYLVSPYRSESATLKMINPNRYIPAFRIELSYVHLEMEHYEEVVTTTLPGFVSQLGGQSGLFVGLSVCTVIQFLLSAFRKTQRYMANNAT